MSTLQLDEFTKLIQIYESKASNAKKYSLEQVQSFKGEIQRLISKRDSLSRQLFSCDYDTAVKTGKYETWI